MNRGEIFRSTGGGRTQSEKAEFKVPTVRHILATKNVPAFKTEPNIDCEDNYIQSIEFELSSIKFPNELAEDYAKTWESVNKQMNDDEEFGKLLKADGFIKDTVEYIVQG